MRSFWNRRKNDSKENAESSGTRMKERDESQPAILASSTLQQACQEVGRENLTEPLSWLINLEPSGRDVTSLLKANDRLHYSVAANAMMYEGRVEKAREYFKRALERSDPGSHWRKELDITLANLDDVVKISHRYWQLNGKIPTTVEALSSAGRDGAGEASTKGHVAAA